jgi:hypothetical protein
VLILMSANVLVWWSTDWSDIYYYAVLHERHGWSHSSYKYWGFKDAIKEAQQKCATTVNYMYLKSS